MGPEPRVAWFYDPFFRPSFETIRGGDQVNFNYDNDGLLTQTGNLLYSRDAANGLLTGATLGSTTTTFGYNDFGELVDEHTTRSSATLYRGVYTRDDGGRLQTRTETIGGATSVEAYTYDLAGRLETVSRNGTLTASYAFDANGNRTGVTTAAGTIGATYDDQDRIVTYGNRTYTHTPHGEVRSWADPSGTTTLTYDVQGNLLAVNLPTGTTVEYVVDARNRRIGRKVNGVVTHGWLYQGQLRPIAELNAAGAIVSRFVYGARAVAPEYMVRAGVSYRLIVDQLGSVRLVVNSTSGAIVQRLDYDAWGQVVTDTNQGFQPFGFAGGLYDASTRLVRFGLRDYDATIGRWLAKDPVGLAAGPSIYEYVGGNPLNRVDPSGLDWFRSTADEGYFVGRRGSLLVPTGGLISRVIENWVPAGRTFGELHDLHVGESVTMGLPDWFVNILSMPIIYVSAVQVESLRSIMEISQQITDWLEGGRLTAQEWRRQYLRRIFEGAVCPLP